MENGARLVHIGRRHTWTVEPLARVRQFKREHLQGVRGKCRRVRRGRSELVLALIRNTGFR